MMGDGVIQLRRLREAVDTAQYSGPIEVRWVEVESPAVWAFGKRPPTKPRRRWLRSEVSRIRSGEPDDGRQREDGIDRARSASGGREGDRFVPSSSPRLRRGPVTRRGGARLRAKQAAHGRDGERGRGRLAGWEAAPS